MPSIIHYPKVNNDNSRKTGIEIMLDRLLPGAFLVILLQPQCTELIDCGHATTPALYVSFRKGYW